MLHANIAQRLLTLLSVPLIRKQFQNGTSVRQTKIHLQTLWIPQC